MAKLRKLPSGQTRRAAVMNDLPGDPFADMSVQDRVDGASGKGGGKRNRNRSGSTEPLHMSRCDFVEALVCFAPLRAYARQLESRIAERRGPGRRRQCTVLEILVFEVATWVYDSMHDVERELGDRANWTRIRTAANNAWPDDPTQWLSDRGPRRHQHYRFGVRHLENDEAVAALRQVMVEFSVLVARQIGACDPNVGSATDPSPANMIVGDGTHIPALYNACIDRKTGEIPDRRYDPDAIAYHQEGQASGRMLVMASVRTEHPLERAILDLDFKPPTGCSDATVFTDMALRIFELLPGAQGTVYDMAIHAENIDRIQDTGRHSISKVQLTKSGTLAQLNMGEQDFTSIDGTVGPQVVILIDGTPTIAVVVDGKREPIQLEGHQVKDRPNKDGTVTRYRFWSVPAAPEVPKKLRGATVMLRHNSTQYERDTDTRRSRFMRTFPESDPKFPALFGKREDTESMHNHMKQKMWNRRARRVGLKRQTINHHGYQLLTNMTALIAWHLRTGGDLTPWFGKWRPPGSTDLLSAAA